MQFTSWGQHAVIVRTRSQDRILLESEHFHCFQHVVVVIIIVVVAAVVVVVVVVVVVIIIIIIIIIIIAADQNGPAVTSTYFLLPLEHWDRRFESRSRHTWVSSFFCVVLSCVGRRLALGSSPVQGVLPNVHRFTNSEKIKFWVWTGHDA
jgi:hypothetical protein